MYGLGFVSGTNQATDDQIISKFLINNNAIWALRVFASLTMTVIATASYFIIRLYPLNDAAAKRIEEVVKSRTAKPEGLSGKEEPTSSLEEAHEDAAFGSSNRETIADRSEDEMLMLNFSQAEIRALVSKGADGVVELRYKDGWNHYHCL